MTVTDNLVPRAFPFFEGKALGTRLRDWLKMKMLMMMTIIGTLRSDNGDVHENVAEK